MDENGMVVSLLPRTSLLSLQLLVIVFLYECLEFIFYSRCSVGGECDFRNRRYGVVCAA